MHERINGRSRTAFRNPNGLKYRTSNEWEGKAARALRDQGYEVLRRGWPDLLAIKGDEIRAVEVKSPHWSGKLKSHQDRVSVVLRSLGLRVEVWPGGEEPK